MPVERMVVLYNKLNQFLLRHTEQVEDDEIILQRTVGEVEEILPAFNNQPATSAQRFNELCNVTLSDLVQLPLIESRQCLTCCHRYIICCKHTVILLKLVRKIA